MSDNNQCSSPGCGCNLSAYPTNEKCPVCGARLRLEGRAERAEFRLACHQCGYQGDRLPQEEVARLL